MYWNRSFPGWMLDGDYRPNPVIPHKSLYGKKVLEMVILRSGH
jgi:hypothetical protein